jgi:hypothetical protein
MWIFHNPQARNKHVSIIFSVHLVDARRGSKLEVPPLERLMADAK